MTFTAGGSFAPKLSLTMDPLTLKPVGSLTASSAIKTGGTRVVGATLSVLGRSIRVGTARTASLAAILLALLTAVALAGVARMTGPVAESERIRAKHGQLILQVMPIALQPGRPVVDLPDVDSLVRLAERYGLLVLHWSRGGVDTYVVQDEGTTFRYRTGTERSVEPLPVA